MKSREARKMMIEYVSTVKMAKFNDEEKKKIFDSLYTDNDMLTAYIKAIAEDAGEGSEDAEKLITDILEKATRSEKEIILKAYTEAK